MSELSQRLKQAISFLENNGFAESDLAIARELNISASYINMAKTGARNPSWDLLLKICDRYPINFDWIRTGKGSMIKSEREQWLLRRIEELEKKIRELEG